MKLHLLLRQEQYLREMLEHIKDEKAEYNGTEITIQALLELIRHVMPTCSIGKVSCWTGLPEQEFYTEMAAKAKIFGQYPSYLGIGLTENKITIYSNGQFHLEHIGELLPRFSNLEYKVTDIRFWENSGVFYQVG